MLGPGVWKWVLGFRKTLMGVANVITRQRSKLAIGNLQSVVGAGNVVH